VQVSRGALLFLVALLGAAGAACGHRHERRSGPFDLGSRRTCLVLSVGGPAGVAHIGAISALREANVRVDCVVGNSMGALVGGLFATAPAENLDARFQAFVAAYAQATEEDAARNGLGLGRLARRLAEENVGGKAAGALAFAGAAVLGMLTTEKMEHERMVRVLDDFLHGQRIDGPLPIRFVTFYQEATSTGVVARRADSGPLDQAIGASIANPLIFTKLEVGPGRPLDPGADRVSATPVQDACATFPDANLVAINVSGQAIFTDATMNCPLLEVRVDPPQVPPEEIMELGDSYQRIVAKGRAATRAALSRVRI